MIWSNSAQRPLPSSIFREKRSQFQRSGWGSKRIQLSGSKQTLRRQDCARNTTTSGMTEALKAQGQLVMATFSLEGPLRCSGLDIVRYSPETIQTELGNGFRLVEALKEEHQTQFNTV